MKEFPSYVKIDKSLGVYAPDLVLHNGCSCPIDIEIDEPYEYKTKKKFIILAAVMKKGMNIFHQTIGLFLDLQKIKSRTIFWSVCALLNSLH